MSERDTALAPAMLDTNAAVQERYHEMLSYAREFGYEVFTPLQEKVFRDAPAYDEASDLFICGETSSGKTLIPLLMYKRRLEQARASGYMIPVPKMLFVIPYRALSAQKTRELVASYQAEGLNVVQSTGEFQQDDVAVQRGEVDIAVIITEKVYKYSSRDSEFLAKYDFLVLDELGLLDNPDRGIRLDFILAQAKRLRVAEGRPQIIALGTPFYDWSAYIQNYQFHFYVHDKRPVDLRELPVFYNPKYGVIQVTPDNPCLRQTRLITSSSYSSAKRRNVPVVTRCYAQDCSCRADEPCRHDREKACPHTGERCAEPIEFFPKGTSSVRNYILERICRYHLSQNHQILIFMNDRVQVQQLCGQLYTWLQDILTPAEDIEAFRDRFLAECGLEAEDVYGILETGNEPHTDMTYYRALSAGIGFHSRELPNELRSYIEEKLMESRELKIVCSTETLAFGINSTVDVVIISDLRKPQGRGNRALTLNEYKNYAGRSGRLLPPSQAKPFGYVYPLISKAQMYPWEKIQKEKQALSPLYSKLFENESVMAFALLNLLPENEALISLRQLRQLIQGLPQPRHHAEAAFDQSMARALSFLLKEKLIVRGRAPSYKGRAADSGPLYGLTQQGQALRGFLITEGDYVLLRDTLQECNSGVFSEIDQERLLYRLLSARHLESDIRGLFSHSTASLSKKELLEFFRLRSGGKTCPQWVAAGDHQKLLILAALLHWMDGGSHKLLYNRFNIHYAMLHKLAEQMGYLLEISWAMIPAVLDQIWTDKRETFEKYGLTNDIFVETMEQKRRQLYQLFCMVFYGLSPTVWVKLQSFLQEQPDDGSAELLERISANHVEPETARLLRRIAVRYRFFSSPPPQNIEDKEVRNNYKNQRWQYTEDIRAMGAPMVRFFEQTLGIQL